MQGCCSLSAVRFGPGDVYCDQICLIIGKYFKCVITEIASRLLSFAVQMIDMLIEEYRESNPRYNAHFAVAA